MQSGSRSRPVGGFLHTLRMVQEQVELQLFPRQVYPLANELCMNIAEVYILPEDALVRIGGQAMNAGAVAEVFSLLQNDHVRLVIENFLQAAPEIKCKKTYLRTALYNAAFEIESHYANTAEGGGSCGL